MIPSTPNSGNIASSSEVREQLDRLRAAIANKQHWILATDDDRIAGSIFGLASLLVLSGADSTQIVLADPDVLVRKRGHKFRLAVAAIAKAVIPGESMAEFIAGVTHTNLAGHLLRIRDGADLFALAVDGPLVAGCLNQINRGSVTVLDPSSN